MSSLTILKNGRILDPSQNKDSIEELWLKDGVVIKSNSVDVSDPVIFDVSGCWVVPGLIDMHVHLREPGEEYKETIETGTKAAAAGGFTAVACMPNTKPVNDNRAITEFICSQGQKGSARVYPVGAISHGSGGEKLAEIGDMKSAGIVAVTDDGHPVVDSRLMRRAMEYASSHALLIMSHSEELALSRGGCMNEGEISTRLGLRGIPVAAESIMVHREIALAELTGARIHISHVSAAASLDLIQKAKARGVKVTAETAPHYFTLTEKAVLGYDTNAKMNPPLRSEEDRLAICRALADGTLDAIATDHAPHSELEKNVEFNFAANGIVGLETSLALTLQLVRDGIIDPTRLVELMSHNPARILGVKGGELTEGAIADVTVIDPQRTFVFSPATSFSKSVNSPFIGWQLQGKAVLTICGGRVTHNNLR
jgi:dihydroorotase